jgi:hypothetical protein
MPYNGLNVFTMSFLFGFNPKHVEKIISVFFDKAKKIGSTSKHDDAS